MLMTQLKLILLAGFTLLFTSANCQPYFSTVNDTSYFVPYDNNFNLILAASKGDLKNAELLISRGADVNSTTHDGVTALMYAADNGDMDMVTLLTQNGADVNLQPSNGLSALIGASKSNHFDVVEYLLNHGADADLKDPYGVTAFHYAAAYNFYKLMDMLIFYKSNINISDLKGNTPLITAAYNNCYEAADILLQNAVDIDAEDNIGFTALMAAIQNNNEDIINLLIESGADINHVNSAGLNPLVLAVKYQHHTLVRRLFEMGVEVNQEKGNRIDMLDLAQSNMDGEMTEILQENEIEPILRPNFTSISFGPAADLNLTDLMSGFSLGIMDRKYNSGFYTGFFFRPLANRVLFELSEDTAYQYWEKRYFFYAGIEKRFPLINKGRASHSGPMIGVKEILSYGSYRGSSLKPKTRLITVPEAGWYYLKKSFLFQIKYEYMNFRTPEINPGRLNFSVYYTVPMKKKSLMEKKISWLNN